MFSEFIESIYNGLSALLLILLVIVLLTVLVIFVVDISQSRDAVRRNYPVFGRFRGLFEHPGTFFRQYFLPWIGRRCHLTARCATGSTGRPGIRIAPFRSVRRVT
ncbi:MAG: hypothetical protein Q9M12_08380 [Mariprofundus sp.]|nr:hypothetical protein [Mariprofundus sp.]